MTTERIKQIQQETGYVDSVSVQQALFKVWNESQQETERLKSELERWQNMANDCVNGEVPKLIAEIKNLKDRHKNDVITAIEENMYKAGDDDYQRSLYWKQALKYYEETFERNSYM